MSSTNEPVTCPFCGSRANVTFVSDFNITCPRTGHKVACSGCGASAGAFSLREDAIAAWNRRESTVTALRARIAELEVHDRAMCERVERLEADAARLDWMKSVGDVKLLRMRRADPKRPKYWDVEYGPHEYQATGLTMRKAIDAALRSARKE